MSRVYWYENKPWFKQLRPNCLPPEERCLQFRVVIPDYGYFWDASRRYEFPYRIIQSAFEHGLQAGQFGTGACPYRGAQEVAWIRGYYYASLHDGTVPQNHPLPLWLCLAWRSPRTPVGLASSPRTAPQAISNIDYWCSDIEYLGSDWGRRMRYAPNPWYRDNELNRLHKESGNHYKARAFTSDNLDTYDQNSYQSKARSGFRLSASGASADKYGELGSNSATGLKKNFKVRGSKNLAGFMSKDQLRFHRGYKKLNYRQKAILWTHFVPEVTQERKLNLLKITQTEYDRLLDLALETVARKIEDIDAKLSSKESTLKPEAGFDKCSAGPLWPTRILSYVHKVAINDSRRNPFPICLSLNGHYNPQSPFAEGPIDSNVYCLRPDGELYAVIQPREWTRLRHKKQLDNHLTDLRASQAQPTLITQESKPIRILRQTRKGQWLVGKENDLNHIRKSKGLEHISIAWQSSEVDALKAILGLDNAAHLPACRSQESFDQKAMRGFMTREGVKIIGIQNPKVQLEIGQKLAEFEEKICEAEEQGQTDLSKQYKKDMADFKSLTKGSCITKTRSRPADGGDIFTPILNNLRQRRTSAMGLLRKAGLHNEADDLENCYKIENRTVIFFASRSRFTWVFDRERK